MAPSTIRPAMEQDLDALLALYRLLDVPPEPVLSPEAARHRLRQLLSNPLQRLYVAEREGRVRGTFALTFVQGISHGGRDSCVVEDVVVDAGAQRSGLGRQMMRFAMDQCALRGCYKLTLSSHVNRDAAHRFYESLGFRRHGYSFLTAIAEAS